MKMIQRGFAVILSLQLLALFTVQVNCYSKVSKSGSTELSDDNNTMIEAPRIHRAREGVTNVDLWFPKVFNKSETTVSPVEPHKNDTSAVKDDSTVSTGRAIDSRPFPFPLKNYNFNGYSGQRNRDPVPTNHRSDNYNKAQYVYPAPVYSSKPDRQRPPPKQSAAMDRYTPGEAYAFTTYQLKKNKQTKYLPPAESRPAPQSQPAPQPAPDKQSQNTYIPPKDLYSFPPNSQSVYPAPGDSAPSSGNSYSPPAAGPPSGYPSYVGPVSPDVLAGIGGTDDKPKAADSGESSGSSMEQPPSDGQDTQPDMSQDTQQNAQQDTPQDTPSDSMTAMQPMQPDMSAESQAPAPGPDDQVTSMEQPPPPTDDSNHHYPYHHDHDHIPYLDHDPSSHGHDFDSSYPFLGDHDHPHDYHLSGLHGIDAFPDVFSDHDHHHDYFDHHHHHPPPPPPPPTTTTTTEEPETEEPEPEQPRVKKYSYFYLARSLWYIPLYFTLWFTFYVTYLILQSIGRHKVDLPNHTVSRRSVTDLSHKQTVEKVNRLTEFVMSQIDGFKDKYN